MDFTPYFSVIGIRMHWVLNTMDEQARVKPALDGDYIIWCLDPDTALTLRSRFPEDGPPLREDAYTVLDLNNATAFLDDPAAFDYRYAFSRLINLLIDFLYFQEREIPKRHEDILFAYCNAVFDSIDLRAFTEATGIGVDALRDSFFWLVGAVFSGGKFVR